MAEQKTITQLLGSSIADWATDPATGKERTPQEIIAAVTDAVLADKSNTYGTTLDPLTGQARPATDAQKVQIALNQLASNARFESSRYTPAKEVAKALGAGDGRGGTAMALRNRPDLWAIGKENVGKIIDRKNFDDPKAVKRFVVDPTTNQLTPEQLKQFKEIGLAGGMAIDPVTGFQVNIDSQGRYTLGEQPAGDLTNLNYATGQKYGAPGAGGVPGGMRGTGGTGGGNPDTLTAGDGTQFNNFSDYLQYQDKLDTKMQDRQSAYDLLYSQFKQYGLESLVDGIKDLITSNVSPSEFSIRLQDTDAYKKRFAANQDRIKQGLKALTPAEYIGLEDQYQNIMRNYGLPASYYSKDSMGTQAGFNKFIANDVSAAELEDRVATAQKRVLNADVNVTDALRQFYPDITNADILAYTLDPTNALENIKRKVTAAEIQGAAVGQGLNKIDASTPEAQVKALEARARELAGLGVTAAQAQQGYGTIAEFLPTAEKLGDIYAKQGMGAYDQATAESEVFGTRGSAEAARKRKKLAQLEQAQFGGSAGTTQGAFDRGRQGTF